MVFYHQKHQRGGRGGMNSDLYSVLLTFFSIISLGILSIIIGPIILAIIVIVVIFNIR